MPDRIRQRLIHAHQEWLGFVQPVGLVVAPMVMVDAQVVPDSNIAPRQREFVELLAPDDEETASTRIRDVRALFTDYLHWRDSDLVDATQHRATLEIALPELQTVLSPTWAVPTGGDSDSEWTMLIQVLDDGGDLDKPPVDSEGWNASRYARFERLLRETGVPVGLLCTSERLRLVYAPKGESAGHLTFEFSQLAQTAGRPLVSALEMLLSAYALFQSPPNARLPALLARSREAQAEVSTQLSRQVLAALHELLRGFVVADARSGGVRQLARDDPQQLYGGLITTLMRLVFVLYAEDRGLMPDHPVYAQNYSLSGLFVRLRKDAAAWPETMNQRFGAWAQLLVLFRLIHGGGGRDEIAFVARKGSLFDTERFPFLEALGEVGELPLVPDETVWQILQSLLVVDGERLSYRTLDVEQIGSVYEAIMGFQLELTTGDSIAIGSQKRTGAAVVVNLDKLIALPGGQRAKALREATDRAVTGQALAGLRTATHPQDIVAALDRVVDRDVTPALIPSGTPVLQPTDERRRSGSHYTPRSLTEPIVAKALEPIWDRLGAEATPAAILDLKVLDPATGSGAFLVEACRQLAGRLVTAWNRHGGAPELPTDEEELLHARRLIALRCLYGVDKNPMAIDLARLSLWLVTLSREQEFTFVDHVLRCGDSLVGLNNECIEAMHWAPQKSRQFHIFEGIATERVQEISEKRERIREAIEGATEEELQKILQDSRQAFVEPKLIGDAVIAAFFAANKATAREQERLKVSAIVEAGGDAWQEQVADFANSLAEGEHPVTPFHWELEFPEVFARKNAGFDVIVGNPPFAGHETIAEATRRQYTDWLRGNYEGAGGKCDVVAFYFRRAFDLLRQNATFGLIATNTIAQGDTRASGLRWVCTKGGMLYNAERRLKWPGEAAVVVSVVHATKAVKYQRKALDGMQVASISAFLVPGDQHEDPFPLVANANKSFQGSVVLGMGFTFDDTDKKGVANSLEDMRRLIDKDARNRDVIHPFIGGEEINSSPTQAHHRYVINFHDWPLRREEELGSWLDANERTRRQWLRAGVVPQDYPDPVANDWPSLVDIVERKVKPARLQSAKSSKSSHGSRARIWWQFYRRARQLNEGRQGLDRVLVNSQVSQHLTFAFIPNDRVLAHTTCVFPLTTYAAFCAMQSRVHELWARFFGSSLEDRHVYTPTDCFETFPFPLDWESNGQFETLGKEYYEFRAELMVDNDEGLTKTYNRFHNPDERDYRILKLRELHAAMDEAVLNQYGWSDIPMECDFHLDYEIDEETWGKKKKPYRYRWSDEVQDEVRGRLLVLNAERARAEQSRN